MDVSYPCVLLLVISASTGSVFSDLVAGPSPSSPSETTSSGPSATSIITTGSSTASTNVDLSPSSSFEATTSMPPAVSDMTTGSSPASTNVDLSPSSSFETTAISEPPSDSTLLTEQSPTATVLGVTPRSSFETLSIIPSAPTTQLLTSTTSFPTSATRNPDTTNQPQTVSTIKPNIERAMFKLTFDVTVNLTFNTDLEEKRTTTFKQYEREFTAKLTEVYLNIPGFVYVEIIGFTNGSIKCNHTCRVDVTAASAEVKDALIGNVTTEMKNKRFFNGNIKQPFSVNTTEVKPRQETWYSYSPIGQNTLAMTVSRLCAAAGFTGFYTNHSLRATCACDEQLIAKRTGHRSNAIRSYKRTSDGQEDDVSKIVQGLRKRTIASTATSPSTETAKYAVMDVGGSRPVKVEFNIT